MTTRVPVSLMGQSVRDKLNASVTQVDLTTALTAVRSEVAQGAQQEGTRMGSIEQSVTTLGQSVTTVSQSVQALSQKFSGTLGATWCREIDGFIIQGGIALSVPSEGTVQVTFPKPFPNAVVGAQATMVAPREVDDAWANIVGMPSLTGMTLSNSSNGGYSSAAPIYWEVKGY